MHLTNKSWAEILAEERKKAYFTDLTLFIESERKNSKRIYPADDEIFNALRLTPFSSVKVVIFGQDPYHQAGQAHGLAFSVKPSVRIPPSLKNIFKELSNDLNIKTPLTGHLTKWALQGVLLLNAVLSVEDSKPMSHAEKGWETFTDRIIGELSESRDHLVFMLWGSYARKKAELIDKSKHLILEAPHPSPLSAHRGFLGCRHFSKANSYLLQQGISPIDWVL